MRAEIGWTWLGIGLTVVAFVAFAVTDSARAAERASNPVLAAGFGVYVVLVASLVFGGLVYQAARLGYLRRLRHPVQPDPSTHLDDAAGAPRVVALVPSYREEPEVVRRALLSAALQLYPNRRVVLLIDDPPDPQDPSEQALLEAAGALPREIDAMLAEPRRRMEDAVASFHAHVGRGGARATREEALTLADHYETAAVWFETAAASAQTGDYASRLFGRVVLASQASEHRHTAAELRAATNLDLDRIGRLYERLGWLFAVEITSFERKRFVNLSRAPNKAMNLNSYIGLIGKAYDTDHTDCGVRLEPRPDGAHRVPDADYVLTLDADSVLVPRYAATLVGVMQAEGNERLAVAQTPYSAIPGPPGTLERLAGATTDMQYIVHQGFTAHEATYWVGANALLRRSALNDIAVERTDEMGLVVRKFIQDRTVIEDTESSVDLIARGWRLHNHPERLSYSATPQDYGALIIQRRRWANGGLIILPKLIRHLARRPWTARKLPEGLFRVHYLTSIAAANVAFLLLTVVPSPNWLFSYWLPATAAPYFILYGRDLKLAGYHRFDVVRVYALNVLLVTANLGGVCKSLHQAVTGRPTPFGRTPKVADRTAAPALYVAAPTLLALYLIGGFVWDLTADRWIHAILGGVTVALLAYAMSTLVGLRPALTDLTSPIRRLTRRTSLLRPRRVNPQRSSQPRTLARPLGETD